MTTLGSAEPTRSARGSSVHVHRMILVFLGASSTRARRSLGTSNLTRGGSKPPKTTRLDVTTSTIVRGAAPAAGGR